MKREDCINYYTYPDMGAQIPCCKKNVGLGNCPCESCSQYTNHIEPCEDCISRDAVESIIDDYIDGSFEWGAMLAKVKKLPSVQPIRPKGEWIVTELFYEGESNGAIIKCNKCGNEMRISPRRFENLYSCEKFCPNCGADMRGEV